MGSVSSSNWVITNFVLRRSAPTLIASISPWMGGYDTVRKGLTLPCSTLPYPTDPTVPHRTLPSPPLPCPAIPPPSPTLPSPPLPYCTVPYPTHHFVPRTAYFKLLHSCQAHRAKKHGRSLELRLRGRKPNQVPEGEHILIREAGEPPPLHRFQRIIPGSAVSGPCVSDRC